MVQTGNMVYRIDRGHGLHDKGYRQGGNRTLPTPSCPHPVRASTRRSLACRIRFLLPWVLALSAAGCAGAAAKKLAAELGKLSPTLKDLKIGGAPVDSLVEPAVELAMWAFRSSSLRGELEARGAAIDSCENLPCFHLSTLATKRHGALHVGVTSKPVPRV